MFTVFEKIQGGKLNVVEVYYLLDIVIPTIIRLLVLAFISC